MIRTKSKVIIPLFLCICLSIYSFGQTKFNGYQYTLEKDQYYTFKYTREYKEAPDTFTTTYKLFHPNKGYHTRTVVAKHYKSKNKIKVIVKNAGGGIFAKINEEGTTYDKASLEPIGFRGSYRAMGGDRIPNQLKVEFISKKYENVNVLNILGSHDRRHVFFILDGTK